MKENTENSTSKDMNIKEDVKTVEKNREITEERVFRNERIATPKDPPRNQVNLKEENRNADRVIQRKEMTPDEFMEVCKEYAKSIDCVMTGETITVLYEKVEELQENKIPLNKENAEALIEEAADRAEKPKLFKKPKYDKDGCLILLEEHFNF